MDRNRWPAGTYTIQDTGGCGRGCTPQLLKNISVECRGQVEAQWYKKNKTTWLSESHLQSEAATESQAKKICTNHPHCGEWFWYLEVEGDNDRKTNDEEEH
jgi:hypothetical protein